MGVSEMVSLGQVELTMNETIRPTLQMPDGTTETPTNIEWLIVFAIKGCQWAIDALPDAFVCFIPGKTRARRYVRSCVKSWDVHIWSGQWEFYDIIGNRTAVEDFDKALHAVALKDLR